MGYIIVKYADDHYPAGRAHISASVLDTYTAKQCKINTKVYETKEAAKPDLDKLTDFNPTVGYGIVEAEGIEQDLPQCTSSGNYL